MKRLLALLTATLLAAFFTAGCSGLRSVASDVTSFGEWPADRKPATYAFDRLPSQQAQAAETEKLENAARPALEKAGFTAAAEGKKADVLVQVGARLSRSDAYYPWGDPFWWNGGFGYSRGGPWRGPYWGLSATFPITPRYDREVAVLIRDSASNKPLFEAHASNDGSSGLDKETLGAMFEAALTDFPRLGVNPRRVVVTVQR